MSDSTVSWNITRCSELDLDFQTLERTMKSILCAAAFLTASSAGAAQINANDGFGNPILVSDNPYWAGDPTMSQQSSKSYAANSGNSSGNHGSSSTLLPLCATRKPAWPRYKMSVIGSLNYRSIASLRPAPLRPRLAGFVVEIRTSPLERKKCALLVWLHVVECVEQWIEPTHWQENASGSTQYGRPIPAWPGL